MAGGCGAGVGARMTVSGHRLSMFSRAITWASRLRVYGGHRTMSFRPRLRAERGLGLNVALAQTKGAAPIVAPCQNSRLANGSLPVPAPFPVARGSRDAPSHVPLSPRITLTATDRLVHSIGRLLRLLLGRRRVAFTQHGPSPPVPPPSLPPKKACAPAIQFLNVCRAHPRT